MLSTFCLGNWEPAQFSSYRWSDVRIDPSGLKSGPAEATSAPKERRLRSPIMGQGARAMVLGPSESDMDRLPEGQGLEAHGTAGRLRR